MNSITGEKILSFVYRSRKKAYRNATFQRRKPNVTEEEIHNLDEYLFIWDRIVDIVEEYFCKNQG